MPNGTQKIKNAPTLGRLAQAKTPKKWK